MCLRILYTMSSDPQTIEDGSSPFYSAMTKETQVIIDQYNAGLITRHEACIQLQGEALTYEEADSLLPQDEE